MEAPTEIAAFRLSKKLKREAENKCQAEDITFSQLVRRGIRRELGDDPAALKERDQEPQPA